MLHGSDSHLLECALRSSEIPDEVLAEYEIRRKMYHRMGSSGGLGCQMIVDMLRSLGLGAVEDVPKVVVQWQDHISEAVDVLYGNMTLRCTLTGLGDFGRLICKHDERGELEMPRHAVKLAASSGSRRQPAVTVDWDTIAAGTPVLVDGSKKGFFVSYEDGVLTIKMTNQQQYTYAAERVQLSE